MIINCLSKPNFFITGVPRSGTTLISEIINCHKSAAILIERFNLLYAKKELNSNCYELENVLNFKKFPNIHKDVNTEIASKIKNFDVKYYGEKIPKFYEDPVFLSEISSNGIILATLRNPLDIFLSYAARKNSKNEKDPEQFALLRGIKDFNRFLNNINSLKTKSKIFCFDYDLSSRQFVNFSQFLLLSKKIFQALDLSLNVNDYDEEKLKNVFKKAHNSLPTKNIERNNRRFLPIENRMIIKHVNIRLYEEFLDLNPSLEPIYRV